MPGRVNTRMLRRAFGATTETEQDSNFDFGNVVPLTVEQSVNQLRARIAELDTKKSGVFLNYDGQKLPW